VTKNRLERADGSAAMAAHLGERLGSRSSVELGPSEPRPLAEVRRADRAGVHSISDAAGTWMKRYNRRTAE
jgi:hypothetical protein